MASSNTVLGSALFVLAVTTASAACRGAARTIACCDKVPTESFVENPYYHRKEGWEFGDEMEAAVPRAVQPARLCPRLSSDESSALASTIEPNAAGMDLSQLSNDERTALHDTFFAVDLKEAATKKSEIDQVWREDQQMIHEAAHLQLPLSTQASGMFQNLSVHGFTPIDHFPGLDVDRLRRQVRGAMSQRGVGPWTKVKYFGAQLSALEPVLRNPEIRAVASAYFGNEPAELTGYAMLHLGPQVSKDDDYPSGQWHHDRCGRRLKLFIYLDDVDSKSHPTWVARGTHKHSWFGIQSDQLTRFDSQWVEANFKERLEPMFGPKAGGFLFDTNTLHKGDVDGQHRPRNVVIVEVSRVRSSYHMAFSCLFLPGLSRISFPARPLLLTAQLTRVLWLLRSFTRSLASRRLATGVSATATSTSTTPSSCRQAKLRVNPPFIRPTRHPRLRLREGHHH